MNDRTDPLEGYEPPPLREQIEPYLNYGGEQLAIHLLHFAKKYGGPGVPPSPADHEADYYCPNCEENVKSITSPSLDKMCACPMCGEFPGALTLGTGPQ